MPITYVPNDNASANTKRPDTGERHVPPRVGEFAYFEAHMRRKYHWIVQTDKGEIGAHFSCAERSLEIPYISCNGKIQHVVRYIDLDRHLNLDMNLDNFL